MLADDIEDRIAIAVPGPEVDELVRSAWNSHTHGLLTEDEIEAVCEAARARRATALPEVPAAAKGAPRGPARRRQRSPDKQASLERQWRLFNDLPLAARLLFQHEPAKGAVVAVIRQQIQERGCCTLSVPEMAARAGVSDRTVQLTTGGAHGLALFIVRQRRLGPSYSDTNVITLTSYGLTVLLSGKMAAGGETRFGPRRAELKRVHQNAGASISGYRFKASGYRERQQARAAGPAPGG